MPPVLSAEIFTVPLEPGRLLVYAPLRQAGFVANSHLVVNFLAALQDGRFDAEADPDGALIESEAPGDRRRRPGAAAHHFLRRRSRSHGGHALPDHRL